MSGQQQTGSTDSPGHEVLQRRNSGLFPHPLPAWPERTQTGSQSTSHRPDSPPLCCLTVCVGVEGRAEGVVVRHQLSLCLYNGLSVCCHVQDGAGLWFQLSLQTVTDTHTSSDTLFYFVVSYFLCISQCPAGFMSSSGQDPETATSGGENENNNKTKIKEHSCMFIFKDTMEKKSVSARIYALQCITE